MRNFLKINLFVIVLFLDVFIFYGCFLCFILIVTFNKTQVQRQE